MKYRKTTKRVPSFLQSALWSYDVSELDPRRDQELIITHVLNFGTWKQLQWALKTYSLDEIKEVLLHPRRGVWREDALNYWEKILQLRVPIQTRDRALFSLTPKVSTLHGRH